MGYVNFLARTLVVLAVRTVGNWLFVIFNTIVSAVFYSLYPSVEAVGVAFGVVSFTLLITNAIHMAWEAVHLWKEMAAVEKAFDRACRHRTVVACDDAIKAYDKLYIRWSCVEDNFLDKETKMLVKSAKEDANHGRTVTMTMRNEIRGTKY